MFEYDPGMLRFRKKAVMINDVRALPRTARPLQVEMLRQDDKSVSACRSFIRGACAPASASPASRIVTSLNPIMQAGQGRALSSRSLTRLGRATFELADALAPPPVGVNGPIITGDFKPRENDRLP